MCAHVPIMYWIISSSDVAYFWFNSILFSFQFHSCSGRLFVTSGLEEWIFQNINFIIEIWRFWKFTWNSHYLESPEDPTNWYFEIGKLSMCQVYTQLFGQYPRCDSFCVQFKVSFSFQFHSSIMLLVTSSIWSTLLWKLCSALHHLDWLPVRKDHSEVIQLPL